MAGSSQHTFTVCYFDGSRSSVKTEMRMVCRAILTCMKRIRCPAVRQERGHPAAFSRKSPFITWIMGFMICLFISLYLILNFSHFVSQRCRWPVAHPGVRGITQWNAPAGVWMCCVGRVHPWGVRLQYQMLCNLTVLHKVKYTLVCWWTYT